MASAEKHLIRPRTAIVAVVVGVVLFVAAFAALQFLMPAQDVHAERAYGYEYSGSRSSSTAFNAAETSKGAMLVFASSELSTPASTVPQIPAAVFGTNDYGMDLMCIGEAFDQSLWHAIAAGAYSKTATNRKVAILASPAWFVDGGVDNETFGLRFSYSLYRQFCDNEQISDASKAYLAKRLAEQGIDDMTIQAGMRTMPQDFLNDVVLEGMDDLKLRKDLIDVRERGLDQSAREKGKIDFKALKEQALADAKVRSTNNDMGIDDEFYNGNLASHYDELANNHADETYSVTPEYDDFNFFLKLCLVYITI